MIIKSILDTDLYKLTQQMAVIKLFPKVKVKYKFFNRGGTQFPYPFPINVNNAVEDMHNLRLTQNEYNFLLRKCPYFERWYLDFLSGYRYDPDEVKISYDKNLNIEIEGYWYRVILWEVPLMAIISELYNVPKAMRTSKDWINDDPMKKIYKKSMKKAINKAKKFEKLGIKYADFGTRRRFSYSNHRSVIENLKYHSPNSLIGTSNVFFAKLFNLQPIGTVAHEWYSYHGSKYGYDVVNNLALQNWKEIYENQLDVALPDTFTSDEFFKTIDPKFNSAFRQDSGDPFIFGYKFIDWCYKHSVKPESKTVIFSDSLNYNEVENLYKEFKGKFNMSFGIGTNPTNDVGVEPLNMVIKLIEVDGKPCIKLSDDLGKETGDLKEIKKARKELNIL